MPRSKRASAYGLFTAGYGLFWFLGSVVIGLLYQKSLTATVIFCPLLAIPLFVIIRRQYR